MDRGTPRTKRVGIDRRRFITAAGATLAAPLVWSRRADAAEQVVVRTAGGAYDEIRKGLVYEPFEKETGIKVVIVAANISKMLAMLKSGASELDVIDTGDDAVYQLQTTGGLRPIPYGSFKFTKPDEINPLYRREYLVGNHVFSRVLGYNSEVFPAGKEPQSWAEFWDAKKFPGPRMLADMASGAPDLEFALIADGVPTDKLYPIDLDRAFASLSRIRPSVPKFWDSGALAAQMMVDKQAVLGSIWHPRISVAINGGAPLKIQWNQNMIQLQCFALVNGAQNPDGAVKFVDYCASAEVQERFCRNYFGIGPINDKAMAALPAELRDNVAGSAKFAKVSFLLNAQWWADNRPAVADRWSKWIIKG
jgi:putative spermidine/putrescine transport system substrate-binding protein